MQYMNIQIQHPEVWNAFLRRINEVKEFLPSGSVWDYDVESFKKQIGSVQASQVNLDDEFVDIAKVDENFEIFKKEQMEKNGQNT